MASFWEVSHTLTLLVQELRPEDVGGDAVAHSAVKAENQTYSCERARAQTPTQEPRTASVAECQLNLLEHVEALHHQISSRMDLIERELDGNTHNAVKLRPLRNSKNNGQWWNELTLSRNVSLFALQSWSPGWTTPASLSLLIRCPASRSSNSESDGCYMTCAPLDGFRSGADTFDC